jgi:hypothetical protein
MSDMNIWMTVAMILYIIPIFWLLDGFDLLTEMAGSKWLAATWVLGWPVFMMTDMIYGGDDE